MKFLLLFLEGFVTSIICIVAISVAGFISGNQLVKPDREPNNWTEKERFAEANAPNVLLDEHPCGTAGRATVSGLAVVGNSIDYAHIWTIRYVCPNGKTGGVIWNPEEKIIKPTPEPDYPLTESTPDPEPPSPTDSPSLNEPNALASP